MNIFTIFILQNVSKIFSKTHQIAPFLKIFSGEHASEPPSKRVASPCKYPHFYKKKIEPPQNKILDTPLIAGTEHTK